MYGEDFRPTAGLVTMIDTDHSYGMLGHDLSILGTIRRIKSALDQWVALALGVGAIAGRMRYADVPPNLLSTIAWQVARRRRRRGQDATHKDGKFHNRDCRAVYT